MSFSDERDCDEESYNKAEMEREGREELEYERPENLGLIPEEHNHGFMPSSATTSTVFGAFRDN